jgi:hypothetical protein
MDYAKEHRSGKIVTAAKASPYGNYRCPICKAAVFLRAGNIYIAHFAHMPGHGKPECDEFHPSEDLRLLWPTNSYEPQGPAIDSLQLSIELEPEYDSRRGPRKWVLRLTVPKSHDGRGEISIDLGGGDTRRIPLANLSLGARPYRAHPSAPDFGAFWISPDVPQPYRAAIEERIPGLSTRTANVFSATSQKQKPLCRLLKWGESYYFVWLAERPIAFPASIPNHMFAETLGWSCSLVTLPDRADPDIAVWLEQTCDLPIARAKREWAMIYPPPYAVDDDGNLQTSSTARLLFAIKPIDDDAENGGDVAVLSGQHSASTKLMGIHRHLVEVLVPEQTPPRPVYLTWDGAPLAAFIARPYPDSAPEPAVVLEFGEGASKTVAPLHIASCRTLLTQVRLSKLRLSTIRVYHGLGGQLRWRKAAQADWQSEELTSADASGRASFTSTSLTSEKVQRITAILQDRSVEVAIDFGAFGSFSAQAIATVVARRAGVRIRRDLRERVEWLCKASGAFVTAERIAVSSLDDAALIRHFSHLLVPVGLSAHRRALERALEEAARPS